MTSTEFEAWYEFVNDGNLRDAAYTGLVAGPEEIGRLKHQNEWLSVENAKLKTLGNELLQWIYAHHYVGDVQVKELMERARKAIQ